MAATQEQIRAKAIEIWEATPPTRLQSGKHFTLPFHLWTDASQKHFMGLAALALSGNK